MNATRRQWLSTCLSFPVLPQVLAAHEHAQQVLRNQSRQFEFLDASAAADVEALADQIIPPTSEGPGASAAGVVYFIDRALLTFASDQQSDFRDGLAQTGEQRHKLFPASPSIAALTIKQQITLLRAIEGTAFFDLLRTLTVLGFLGDPSYGGNKNGTGWKQIGFEPQMAYRYPFGYYDAEVASQGDPK